MAAPLAWTLTRNQVPVARTEIPRLTLAALGEEIVVQGQAGLRLASLFGLPEGERLLVYAVLAGDDAGTLRITSAECAPGESYPSLTPAIPAAHILERELWEQHGLRPDGHPWLKPVRYPHDRGDRAQVPENYPFFRMEGQEVHEVAVGPVHAGVIEPGHFRFMCTGEEVHHLEIQLGYQHRGVERLLERPGNPAHPGRNRLAESIAGDTVVGHGLAYAGAMEALIGLEAPERAVCIREIALELERISIHLGDLSAIANDVAYLTGNAVFGALRTKVINTSLEACGSRFGRSWVQTGGVRGDLDEALRDTIAERLAGVLADAERMADTFFSSASVLSRLEKTGPVTRPEAKAIGLLGLAARASGLPRDIRASHPRGGYARFPRPALMLESGDVYARAMLRFLEIRQSVELVRERLEQLPAGPARARPEQLLAPDRLVVSLVEGWRGEILHAAVTGPAGQVLRYRVQDPSLWNWFGLALAVRREGISDFPLCNKSFNLSYCGHDL